MSCFHDDYFYIFDLKRLLIAMLYTTIQILGFKKVYQSYFLILTKKNV